MARHDPAQPSRRACRCPHASSGKGQGAGRPTSPTSPCSFVVGFPPGGADDLLARLVAPGIGERLKRTVVVENRAGANGEIAAASVAKAPPDGSVFMLASNSSTTVAPALDPHLAYDVRIDFTAVAPVAINPMLLVVKNDLPARNVAELLALARERPGKLNGASAGAGGDDASRPRAASSRWARSTSCTSPTRAADRPWPASCRAWSTSASAACPRRCRPSRPASCGRSAQTSARAIAGGGRHPDHRRIGLAGLRRGDLLRRFLPAATSPPLVERLHAAIEATLRSPEVAQKLVELGADPQFATPAQFAAYVAADIAKWARRQGLVKDDEPEGAPSEWRAPPTT